LNIKYLVYYLFIGILFLSCKSEEKNHIKFEISGNLESYDSKEIVLQSDEINGIKTIFIAKKLNGNFYIKSKKSLPINQYYLKIGTDVKRIPVLIDNTDVNIYLDNLDLNDSFTKGNSEYQKTYANYISKAKNTQNLFAYQKHFVENNKNTELGAIVLKDLLGKTAWRLQQSKSLFDGLAPLIQKSDLGKEIDTYITAGLETLKKEKFKQEKNTEEIVVSKPKPAVEKIITSNINLKNEITEYAPYFYATNLASSELSAKTIFNKNKLTLIDFWASWCAPCRAQNSDLLRLYKKYHTKGFEILSVSEDKDLNSWQVAVTVDNMNWLHVKDDYKRIANMYKVNAIPYALLVNEQGGIIAKKVSVNQLESLLQKEFGY